ncbi:hypothetical protein KI809_10580 [Geobacter pelophilus]|uniref:Uncharacterized protein n=1 Tax=Geoanaerobacter pelophilus TaxID=60036 RepID=A0AAW4L5D8_9BACT|nr:hypothetical protein [Geoanaerobacter pelophilus]MBT0664745.1 hypothetical protein [Geoanaerobacter pelophilus]
MKAPYYLVTASCRNNRCKQFGKPFTKQRKTLRGMSTSGAFYDISQLACPECRNWSDISNREYVGKREAA